MNVPANLLEVECPYTGCGADPGVPCRNAVDGSPMPNGHPERRREARRASGVRLGVKAPGETCKLTYRWEGDPEECPREGDVLQTGTGRRYSLLEVGGGAPGGSMRIKALVMGPGDELPEGARVYPLAWDRRGK